MKRLLFCTITLVLMLFALASCFGENHEYSGPCDPTCNSCNRVTREPETEHVYDDCNATTCKVCGEETREGGLHEYKAGCDTDCEICGEVRETEVDHIFDSPCDTDCNACASQRVASQHIYTNDCDTDCNFCGEQRVTTHLYTNACDKTCNVCDAYRIPAAHVYSNNCDSTCDVCGELRMVPNHVYSATCDADCNVCGEARIAQPHVYDHPCDDSCNVCGSTRVVSDHLYDNDCDASCNRCGEERQNAHSFGAWSSKKAANCTDAELLVRVCGVCGAEEFSSGKDALGHSYTNDCDIACDRAGCNERRTITHTFGAWETKLAATCTTDEVEIRTCGICGHTETQAGDEKATGHKYDDETCDVDCNVPGCNFPRKAPHVFDNIEDLECNECGASRMCTGHRPYENDCTLCAVCGDTIEDWKHTFGAWETLTPANCTEDEVEYRVCSVCGVTETRTGDVPALDHLWDNACDTACNREGCDFTRTITHAYEWVTKTAANCYADEVQHEYCDICGNIGDERTMDGTMLTHTYTNECDNLCDLCGTFTRTPPHKFADEHDVTCDNGCGHTRPCNGHAAKETDCTICRYCEASIPEAMHTYSYECDTECNVCRSTRVAYHDPSDADCTVCSYCGENSGATHEATESDCTVCKNCQAGTGIRHEASADDCTLCENCQQASGVSHTPDREENCTKCEICGKESGVKHEDENSDGACDHCGKETLPGDNWFPWAPL